MVAKAFPTYGPYVASKAGVEGLVHVLANEFRGRQITVNAVAPGPVGTELFLAGKTLIGLYLGRSAVGTAYGAAGSLLVLLVWVYYSSLVLLLGAEITQAHASMTAAKAPLSEHAEPVAVAKA